MNKLNALSGQGLAHSEIGQSVNCRELKFHDQVVIPYDNGDGNIWFTADTLAGLLGYADKDKVLNLYYRHEDEFSQSMTTIAKVRVNGINNSLREIDTRLFSPRGAHLIGMVVGAELGNDPAFLVQYRDATRDLADNGEVAVDHDCRRLQQVLGDIADTKGVHGIAIAPELNRGFTSNGGTRHG